MDFEHLKTPVSDWLDKQTNTPEFRKKYGEIPIISDLLFGMSQVLAFLVGAVLDAAIVLVQFIVEGIIETLKLIVITPMAIECKKAAYKLVEQKIIPRDLMDNLFRYAETFGDFKDILTIMVGIKVGMGYVDALTQIPMFYTQRYLMERFRPQLPTSGEVMRAAFVAPEKTELVWDILQKQGYPEEYIKLMFLANYNTYDENMVRELYYRKVLTKDEMYIRMRELGYTDTRINEISQAWDLIPGPADLLMMVAKEAFEPDEIIKYGLGDEFPEEQSEWLEKQGLSRYWQEKYWAAHWDYPSYQQVLEMLHRGEITEEDVYQYYRVIEIPKYWRDKLTKINYNPYTRVDVRRMHALGVVGDEQLIRAYLDQGYDMEHAKGMANFTIKYNQTEDKALTRAQIERGYKTGLIDRDEARIMLIEIDYHPKSAEFIMDQLDFDISTDYVNELIDVVGEQYKNHLITEQEARQKLYKIDLPDKKVSSLLAKWDLRKIDNTRLPSKADLEKMLTYAIISPEDYYDVMYKTGYSEEHIMWFLNLFYYQLSEQLEEVEE